jgi:hypothetical protein
MKGWLILDCAGLTLTPKTPKFGGVFLPRHEPEWSWTSTEAEAT